jgi:hypothetical protein
MGIESGFSGRAWKPDQHRHLPPTLEFAMTTEFPGSPAPSHLIRVTRAVGQGTFTVPSGRDAHTVLEEISMLLDCAAQAAFETCDNAAVRSF